MTRPKGVFLNVVRQLLHAPAVVYPGKCGQQSVIGFLRYFGPAMQIGDPLTHRPPLAILLRSSFFGPEDRKSSTVLIVVSAPRRTLCVDPRNAKHVTLGISCDSVWSTPDGGL